MTQTLPKTDAELKGAVTEELVWTAGLTAANIGVAADDGAVTLSGEAEPSGEAARPARDVAGSRRRRVRQ